MTDTQEIVAQIWADVMSNERRIAADAARADPEKHKCTRIFPGSTRFSYWEAKDRRGSRVRFCYSAERNAAGYFMGWREVETAKAVKRRDFHVSQSKRDIKARCYRQFQAFKSEQPA
jgi:hypothetical protein